MMLNRRSSMVNLKFQVVCLILVMLVSGLSYHAAVAATSPRKYNAEFWISKLECINGEEDDHWYSSGEDEIYGMFTLNELAPDGSILQTNGGAFGVFTDVERGESLTTSSFPRRTLPLVLSTSRISVAIKLMEEDGDKGGDFVKSVNKWGDKAYKWGTKGTKKWYEKAIVKVPEWYLANVISLPARVWSFDGDNRLGFNETGLHQLSDPPHGTITKTLTAKGRNNLDNYEYKITYKINLMNP